MTATDNGKQEAGYLSGLTDATLADWITDHKVRIARMREALAISERELGELVAESARRLLIARNKLYATIEKPVDTDSDYLQSVANESEETDGG